MKSIQKKRKKNIGQYIGVFLVISMASMLFAGFLNTAELEKQAVTEYYRQYNLPDIWMMYQSISSNSLKRIQDTEGVRQVQERYVYEFSTQNRSQKYATILAMSYKIEDQQSIPYMVEGQLPEEKDEIILDYEYAKQNKIAIGECISLKLKGKSIQVTVTGYMESVEYPAKIPDSYSDIPDSEVYGIAYLSEATFREEYGTVIEKNQMIIDVEDEENATQIASKLEEKEDSDQFLYSITRETDTGYNLLLSSYESNQGYAWLCLIVFGSISVLLLISATKSLWMTHHKKKPVVSILLSIVAVASGLGSCLGEYAVAKVVIYSLQKQTDIGIIEITMVPKYILFTLVVMLVMAALVIVLSCRRFRKKDATLGYEVFELSEIKHMTMKNIWSSKALNISVLVGVALSMAVIMLGVGLYQSVEMLIRLQYKEILKADVIVEMEPETIQEDGNMVRTDLEDETMFQGTLSVSYTKIRCQLQNKTDNKVIADLVAFTSEEDRAKLYGILDEDNQPMQVKQGGIVISKTLSDTFHLKEGDTVSFESVDQNFEKRMITAEITGVSNQYYSQEIYCTQDFLIEQGFVPCASNRYVSFQKGEMSLQKFQQLLQDKAEVKKVKSVNRIAENMDAYCKDTIYDVYCFGVIGLIIIFAVIVCTSNIKYLERMRGIEKRKKMGYDTRNFVRVFTSENVIVCVLGAVVGIPLGIAILQMMLGAHEVGSNMFPIPSYTYNAMGALVVSSIFSWICSYVVWHRILLREK